MSDTFRGMWSVRTTLDRYLSIMDTRGVELPIECLQKVVLEDVYRPIVRYKGARYKLESSSNFRGRISKECIVRVE